MVSDIATSCEHGECSRGLTGSDSDRTSSAVDLPPYSLSEKTVQSLRSSLAPKEYRSLSAWGYGFCTAPQWQQLKCGLGVLSSIYNLFWLHKIAPANNQTRRQAEMWCIQDGMSSARCPEERVTSVQVTLCLLQYILPGHLQCSEQRMYNLCS